MHTFPCVGVGGIEAEAVMLGQAISMVLPEVVGCKLVGKIGSLSTSTDVVLTITKVRWSLCMQALQTSVCGFCLESSATGSCWKVC